MMCGGAPHAVVTARKLKDAGIPSKLILDRTFDNYANVVKYSSIMRNIDVVLNGQGSFIDPIDNNIEFTVGRSLFKCDGFYCWRRGFVIRQA